MSCLYRLHCCLFVCLAIILLFFSPSLLLSLLSLTIELILIWCSPWLATFLFIGWAGCLRSLACACHRLRRRRLGGASGRHGRSSLGFHGSGSGGAFANGSSFSSRGASLSGGGGGGSGGDDEGQDEEQDEGQMAEDASLMFLTAIRQVLAGKGGRQGRSGRPARMRVRACKFRAAVYTCGQHASSTYPCYARIQTH